MKLLKIISAVVAFVLIFTFTGCGKKLTTFSLEDVLNVTLDGSINGEASINVARSSKNFHAITSQMYPDGYTDVDYAQYEILLYEGIELSVEGDTENVSNGDEITISAVYSEDNFNSKGLVMNPTSFTYTVEGLTEPTVIDIFEGVSVEFDGVSGEATLTTINTDNSPAFIKSNVSFSPKNYYSELKNGDTVTVIAGGNYENSDEFIQNAYKIEVTEKTFTVSGLPEYISNSDGYDFAEIELKLDKDTETEISDKYTIGSTWYTNEMLGKEKGNLGDIWQVDSVEITPGNMLFWTPMSSDNDIKNSLSKFYLITINMTKTKMAWSVDKNKDGYQVGDTHSFTIPYVAYVHNLSDENGIVKTDNAKWYQFLYSSYDYVSDNLPDIEQHWIENNPDFSYVILT
jgi:uncharacterized lipoprotein YehR (DUF1307 family)